MAKTPLVLSELRRNRRAQTLNHWLFLPILLALFLGSNYIGWRHYFRKDFSLNRFQQLSGQSLNLVKSLPAELRITAFLAPDGDSSGAGLIQDDVLKLLDEYKYRAGGKIKVAVVQPYLDFQEAQRLAEKFKLANNENVVILEYGDRSRVLKVSEMAEIDPGMMPGMTDEGPRVKSFYAEEKISSAISLLVQGKPSRVYVAEGHGEYNLRSSDQDPAGYSKVAARLSSQNMELLPWKPGADEGVPLDADVVLVAGAKFPWSPASLAALKAYLAKPGRLVLALDPGVPTGLETLLEDQGIVFDGNKIYRKMAILSSAVGLTQGNFDETEGTRFSLHPAIRWIENVGGSLRLGAARSLTLKPKPPGSGPQVEMLVETSENFWAKTWPLAPGKKTDFIAGEDRRGPFTVAAVIDGSAPGDKGKEAPCLRVVAVGSGSAFANKNLSSLEVDFMVNALQWAIGRHESLGISPKEPMKLAISLDSQQQRIIILSVFLGIPFLTAAAGAFVWWRRRH